MKELLDFVVASFWQLAVVGISFATGIFLGSIMRQDPGKCEWVSDGEMFLTSCECQFTDAYGFCPVCGRSVAVVFVDELNQEPGY